MKFAAVAPIGMLDTVKGRPYHLCLAQLILKHDHYAEFYREELIRGSTVIIDNGAAEDVNMDWQDLIWAAASVLPKAGEEFLGRAELVLPDVIGNPVRTFMLAVEALPKIAERFPKLPLVYVLQGTTIQDIASQLSVFVELQQDYPQLEIIALSKFFDTTFGSSRIGALGSILARVEHVGCAIHLLGLMFDPLELAHIERRWPDAVQGADSSWPFVAAQLGYHLLGERRVVDELDLEGQTNHAREHIKEYLEAMDLLALGHVEAAYVKATAG